MHAHKPGGVDPRVTRAKRLEGGGRVLLPLLSGNRCQFGFRRYSREEKVDTVWRRLKPHRSDGLVFCSIVARRNSIRHPNLCESPKRLCCVPVYHHMGTALIVSTRYDSPYSGIPCRYWLSSLLCDGEIGLPTQKCRCGQSRSSHHNCAPVDTTGWLRVRCRVIRSMPKSSG